MILMRFFLLHDRTKEDYSLLPVVICGDDVTLCGTQSTTMTRQEKNDNVRIEDRRNTTFRHNASEKVPSWIVRKEVQ